MLTLDKRSGHARLYIMQPGGNDMDYSVSLHDSYLITTLTFTEYFGLATIRPVKSRFPFVFS